MQNKLLERFFGPRLALDAVRESFKDAALVRIATAFFEPTGWSLLADTLEGKEVRVLIGREEGAADKIGELLHEFFDAAQSGALKESPTALNEILNALKAGKLTVRFSSAKKRTTLDARYLYHHAKLYIADKKSCIVTSANFTRSGLLTSREAGVLVSDKEQVDYFVETFDAFFAAAESLTQNFIDALEELLDLRTPEEVYLRALLEIYGMADTKFSENLPTPALYQKPVIARLVRSVTDFGGAFLVASTGLGKTVIASHTVAFLRAQGHIHAVIVFAPAGLKDMWANSMRQAHISSREFSYQILSVDDWKKFRQAMLLEDELSRNLSGVLIILDESHHMRNEEDTPTQTRLRHKRILQGVKAGAKILLLTATPYSRGVDDINNQLRLLPKHSVKGEFFESEKSWKVEQPGELSELAPCTVLTAPTVVKHFSRSDELGRKFVEFGNDKRLFFPEKLHLLTVQFENPFNAFFKELKMSQLLRRRVHQEAEYESSLFESDTKGGRNDPLFEARLMHLFCSSPARVKMTLEQLSREGGYEKMRFEAQTELTILAKSLLEKMETLYDTKFDRLLKILKEHSQDKIVVFCIYKETALELLSKLKKHLPETRLETTVDRAPEDLESVLDYFAPVANGRLAPGSTETDFSKRLIENKIDILIASEAISEGFNLQDARILVNYDLPWSILQLAQRMGRLMRPWHEVRDLVIYNFLPDTMFDPELRHAGAWHKRLDQRNREHQSFAALPVLMPQGSEVVKLASLGEALRAFEKTDLDLGDAMDFVSKATHIETSGVLDDLVRLSEERQAELKCLRQGFRSRVKRERDDPALFMLVQRRGSVFPALFDAQGKFFAASHEVTRPLEILRKKRDYSPFTENFNALVLDAFQEKCIETWLVEFSESRENVRVVCALHFA